MITRQHAIARDLECSAAHALDRQTGTAEHGAQFRANPRGPCGATGVMTRGSRSNEREVVGDDGPLHKAPGAGWSHKRWQNTVDEAVDDNATEVVAEIRSLAARLSVFSRKIGAQLDELVSVTDRGGRDSEDGSQLQEAVTEIAQEAELAFRSKLLDRLAAGQNTGLAVEGLGDVVDAGR